MIGRQVAPCEEHWYNSDAPGGSEERLGRVFCLMYQATGCGAGSVLLKDTAMISNLSKGLYEEVRHV
jgi:hypothetical protein